MRERLALLTAILTAASTLLLALAFAWVQNRPEPGRVEAPPAAPAPPSPPEPAAAPGLAKAGRAVYEAQGCSMCHSIGGVGNPRYPLDGVGARLGAGDLRKWVVGAPELEDRLPAGAFRLKQGFQALPAGELDALVAYLQGLGR